MTLAQRQRGLTIRARHPRWLQVYPPGFWQPWHMSLLGHDMLPTERPVALMDSLYRTDLQRTPAAAELLSFEARTSLPHLPHQTGVTETLLLDFAQELEQARDPRTFWPPQSLQRHFNKHISLQDSGPYLQGAARAGMMALARLTGVAPAQLAPLDPGNVDDAWGYAQLARLLLLLSLAAERPFGVATRSRNFTPLSEIDPPARSLAVELAERPRQRHFFRPPQVVSSQADMLPAQR